MTNYLMGSPDWTFVELLCCGFITVSVTELVIHVVFNTHDVGLCVKQTWKWNCKFSVGHYTFNALTSIRCNNKVYMPGMIDLLLA